ncbi:MAG: response regulator [Geminicoccaceae bacterium]
MAGRQQKHHPSLPRKRVNGSPFAGPRTVEILYIEDDDLDFDIARRGFSSYPHADVSLTRATSLREGLERLARKHFDLLLLDLNLPDSSPHETAALAAELVRKVPILLVTGETELAPEYNTLPIRSKMDLAPKSLALESLLKLLDTLMVKRLPH